MNRALFSVLLCTALALGGSRVVAQPPEAEAGEGVDGGQDGQDSQDSQDSQDIDDENARLDTSDADDEAGTGSPRAKVAVVTVGDPDDALRASARTVENALADEPSVVLPGDPGIAGALRGEPGTEDDGLDRVRSERRQLGLDEQDDATVLTRLGRLTGSVAVVAVRREGDSFSLTVFDVTERRFYDGELALAGAAPAAITRFVGRRARASARHAGPTRVARRSHHEMSGSQASQSADNGAGPRASGDERGDPPEQKNEVLAFLEEAWPYFAAGILLAGLVTWVLLRDDTPEPAVPVLRFIPGGR